MATIFPSSNSAADLCHNLLYYSSDSELVSWGGNVYTSSLDSLTTLLSVILLHCRLDPLNLIEPARSAAPLRAVLPWTTATKDVARVAYLGKNILPDGFFIVVSCTFLHSISLFSWLRLLQVGG